MSIRITCSNKADDYVRTIPDYTSSDNRLRLGERA